MELYFLDKHFCVMNVPYDTMTSVVWSLRYYSCGTFTVFFPGCDRDLTTLADTAVYLCDRTHCGRIEYISVQEDGLELRGRMLECLLSDRLLQGNRTYTGALTDVVLTAFRENAGDLPLEAAPEQPRVETEVTFAGSWEPLGDWLYSNLQPYGVSYSVSYDNEAGKALFHLLVGKDRTYDGPDTEEKAIFSEEFGNIASLTFEKEQEKVCGRLYLEGDDGVILTIDSPREGDGGREMYRKVSDLCRTDFPSDSAYHAALTARGEQILKEYSPLIRLNGTAEGDAQPRYGTGYALGDVCELHSTPLGIAMKTQLTGLDIVCENGVEQLYPYFGDEISGIRRLMQKMNV